MRIRLIVNPAAGGGRGHRWLGRAARHLARLGAEVEVIESRDREHLIELGRDAGNESWDRVVACGGDGTLHLLIRQMDLTRCTVGILPSGSGDDFARALGIPRDVEAACELLLCSSIREVDVALANGIRYLGVAGLGFDSIVARYANEHAKFLPGALVYLYSILRVLPQFRPYQVAIERDGARSDQEIMFAAVGNSSRYGGGIRIVPTAVIDDRQLDLCVVNRCGKGALLRTLPLAYSGRHVRREYVTLERGARFRFESDEPLEVFADGEPVTETPVTIELAPERLHVVAPWDGSPERRGRGDTPGNG